MTEKQEAGAETPTVSATLLDWLTAYLDVVKATRARETYEEKRRCMRAFIKHFGPDVTVEDVLVDGRGQLVLGRLRGFFDAQARERSGNAANKDRKNLGAAWGYGARYVEGFPRHLTNPFSLIELYAADQEPRYVPPLGDFWAVYGLTQGQDRVMLLTALHLAARRGELFRMRKDDYRPDLRQVRLWTRKRMGGGLESDWLPVTRELGEALDAWIREHPFPDSESMFVCLEDTPFTAEYRGKPFLKRTQWLRRMCDRAGVARFGLHGVRHLTARHLYEQGYPLAHIQRVLRHKAESTTRIYLAKLGVETIRMTVEQGMPRQGKLIPFPNASKETAPDRVAAGG